MKKPIAKKLLKNIHTSTYVDDDVNNEINRLSMKYRKSKSHIVRTILENLFRNNNVGKYMD